MQLRILFALAVAAGTWGGVSLAQSTEAEPSGGEESTEARRRRAIEKEEELHALALEWTPDGWSSERSERFLVIHQDSPKHARNYVDQGEAVLSWLDETLFYIGPESYVRAPVLRIAKDYDELKVLRKAVGQKSWRAP